MTSSYSDIVRHNAFTYFNLVNIVLFVFVLITGRIHNGMFILTVVFNTFIGIYQEVKAKKLLEEHPEYLFRVETGEIGEAEVMDSSQRYGYYLLRAGSGEELRPYLPA